MGCVIYEPHRCTRWIYTTGVWPATLLHGLVLVRKGIVNSKCHHLATERTLVDYSDLIGSGCAYGSFGMNNPQCLSTISVFFCTCTTASYPGIVPEDSYELVSPYGILG